MSEVGPATKRDSVDSSEKEKEKLDSMKSAIDDVQEPERLTQKATRRSFRGWGECRQVQGMDMLNSFGFRCGIRKKQSIQALLERSDLA